jgi:hypothetical protein
MMRGASARAQFESVQSADPQDAVSCAVEMQPQNRTAGFADFQDQEQGKCTAQCESAQPAVPPFAG